MSSAVESAEPGDTVYIFGGTYSGWSEAIHPVRSGTADAWITFAALPGELPIFEGSGVGSGTYEYIRYLGLVSRSGSSGGFGNGWTDSNCAAMSNSHLQYINCIADGNGINGIAHYCATGLLIKQSIIAHNGNQDPSWSSGVNLFSVQGDPSSNVVEQSISFENIDISSHHSDGSGFILDQNSTGATFINNIGFRNGGSCIRITNSTNAQIINNTCFNNGQDPTANYHDEIFFSDTSTTHQGALLRNNLCIPTSGQSGLTMGTGVPSENDEFDGSPSLVVSAAGDLDLHLIEGASAVDAGAPGAPTPSDDIGFDWRCIKQQSGQAVSWWMYAIDYDYIASIGGVAACFAPVARDSAPDQGAYEFGGSPVPSTGGASGADGTESGGDTSTGPGGASPGGSGGSGTSDGTGGASSSGTSGSGTSDGTGGTSPSGAGGASTGGATSSSVGTGGVPSTGGDTGGVAHGGGATPSTGGLSGTGAALGSGGAGAVSGGAPGAGGSVPSGAARGGNGGDAAVAGPSATGDTTAGGTAADEGLAPAERDTNDEDSGCSCRTPRHATGGGWFAAALGLLVGLARLRRR